MNDDISRAFSSATPHDIADITSTHVIEAEVGAEDFRTFVERHLSHIPYAFAAADGEIMPLITLSDGRVERVYPASDGESVGEYFARVSSMAERIGATRMFFFRFQSEVQSEADPTNTTHEGVVWYANDRALGEERHGVLLADSTLRLSKGIESERFTGLLHTLAHGVLN